MKKAVALEVKQSRLEFVQAGELIEGALAEGLEAGCLMVEREAKKRTPVRTGRLRASISHRLRREMGEIQGEVGTNVDYASYVENGTSRNKPHPFLNPGLEACRQAINQLVAAAIRKATK